MVRANGKKPTGNDSRRAMCDEIPQCSPVGSSVPNTLTQSRMALYQIGDHMNEAAGSEGNHVSPECFHAYVGAEIKVPNTLTAVGPYVGHTALKALPHAADINAAVKHFASTYKFSRHQMESVIKSVSSVHGRFGVLVLPEGTNREVKEGIRLFRQERFEVVYMEGVMNILESILRLHGMQGKEGSPRGAQVAELLSHPDKLATTIAVFAAAEHAVNSPGASAKSDVFREQFNFIKSGAKSRPMNPEEKIAIQSETIPFITAAVRQVLDERNMDLSQEQVGKFVFILTSPELHEEAV